MQAGVTRGSRIVRAKKQQRTAHLFPPSFPYGKTQSEKKEKGSKSSPVFQERNGASSIDRVITDASGDERRATVLFMGALRRIPPPRTGLHVVPSVALERKCVRLDTPGAAGVVLLTRRVIVSANSVDYAMA
ncbi:hypothetical protein MRX96_042310 [Rhipicephalus microplus]